jgi:hypothetical protein
MKMTYRKGLGATTCTTQDPVWGNACPSGLTLSQAIGGASGVCVCQSPNGCATPFSALNLGLLGGGAVLALSSKGFLQIVGFAILAFGLFEAWSSIEVPRTGGSQPGSVNPNTGCIQKNAMIISM